MRRPRCGSPIAAWGIHWTTEQLGAAGRRVGERRAVFPGTHGAAICRGRGEQVETHAATVPLDVVIVKPPWRWPPPRCIARSIELPGSGRAADPQREQSVAVARRRNCVAARSTDWVSGWAIGCKRRPRVLSTWIGRMQAAFAELDFLGHQLSGSGSAYFGICRHAQHARRLASILKTRQLGSRLRHPQLHASIASRLLQSLR